MTYTYRQAMAEVRALRARVVEEVRTKDGLRLNLVLPNGKPRTLKVHG